MAGKTIQRIEAMVCRNRYGLMNIPSKKNRVNVESYPIKNVGDTLGPVIVHWLLEKANTDSEKQIAQTKHLLSVGSVVSFGRFDATVWGSGILNENAYAQIKKKSKFYHRKLDVRAVRGPYTRDALMKAGYDCPKIYGDPAILLPLVYPAVCSEKKYKVSIILHHESALAGEECVGKKKYHVQLNDEDVIRHSLHFIDPITDDYKFFVDEIVSSEYVVSSSLHGIIIAESYGIPAVFLNFGVDQQNIKFRDWYESTNRTCASCHSIEAALNADKTQLPDLKELREQLIAHFPYDLWS